MPAHEDSAALAQNQHPRPRCWIGAKREARSAPNESARRGCSPRGAGAARSSGDALVVAQTQKSRRRGFGRLLRQARAAVSRALNSGSALPLVARSTALDGGDVCSRVPQDCNLGFDRARRGLRVRGRGFLRMCAWLPGSTVEGMSLSFGVSGCWRWAGESASDHGSRTRMR